MVSCYDSSLKAGTPLRAAELNERQQWEAKRSAGIGDGPLHLRGTQYALLELQNSITDFN
jgi:hypothetical protein